MHPEGLQPISSFITMYLVQVLSCSSPPEHSSARLTYFMWSLGRHFHRHPVRVHQLTINMKQGQAPASLWPVLQTRGVLCLRYKIQSAKFDPAARTTRTIRTTLSTLITVKLRRGVCSSSPTASMTISAVASTTPIRTQMMSSTFLSGRRA